jgi:WD40 repeat protein
VGAGPVGGRSGAQSSWAKQAGQSSSKLTTASGRRIPRPVAADTAGAGETGPMTPAPVTMAVRARRRWPVIIAGLAVVALVAAGVAAFRPKAPPPAGATPAPPPDPAGEIRKFIGHTGAVENVAFTPDGTRLVTASQDTTARVWDVATGKELVTFTGHNEAVRGLAVLPDGKRVATAGWGGHVRLWDLDTGRELRDYKGHTDEVWWVACDAAGRRLLTAGKDRTVRLWDVETGRELKRLSGGHLKTVTAAVFLPDGHRAVSAGEDGILCLWDLDTGKVTLRKQAPKMVYRLSLCPNGRRILFGCDRTVVRWDPDGAVHPAPVATTDAVESAVGLPDGRLVLAVKDGTVRVWGLNPDRELHRFPASEQPVLAVAVAPDGKHVASGGRDKLARLWRLPVK